MTHYPHSANYIDALLAIGHTIFGAAEILLPNGRIRRSGIKAQRLAGSALDLTVAAKYRRNGDYHSARARLEFARAARLALTP